MLKAKKNDKPAFMIIDEAEHTTTFYNFSDIPLTEEQKKRAGRGRKED